MPQLGPFVERPHLPLDDHTAQSIDALLLVIETIIVRIEVQAIGRSVQIAVVGSLDNGGLQAAKDSGGPAASKRRPAEGGRCDRDMISR